MPYQPLTEEQFNKARASGFTTEQIVEFEKKRKQEQQPMFKSEAEGRIALSKQLQEQKKLEQQATPLSIAKKGLGNTALAYLNPLAGNIPEIIAQKTGTHFIPPEVTPTERLMGTTAALLTPFGVGSNAMRLTGEALSLANPVLRMAAQGAVGGLSVLPLPQEAPTLKKAAIQMGAQAGLGAGLGAAASMIPPAIQFARNIITGPERATQAGLEAKLALEQRMAQEVDKVRKIGDIKEDIALRSAESIQTGYKNLTETLKKQISSYSDKEAQQLQKDLPRIFGKKSREFGDNLQKIIESLPAQRTYVPAEKVVKGIENSLIEHGVLRYEPSGELITAKAPLSSAEQQLYNLYSSTRNKILDNPDAIIDVRDLIKSQRYIQPKFGKTWTPDERLKASVSENLSGQIEDIVPEIKNLRSSYRPFLEWKKQIIKDTNPFGSQYDTQKAASLLSKVGTPARVTGGGYIRPDEERLVSQLEQVIGRQVGGGRISALNKGLIRTQQNQLTAKEIAKQNIDKLKENIAADIDKIKEQKNIDIQKIEAETNKLVRKYKNQRILFGAGLGGLTLASGGKLLEYFIRREAYSGLHGRY